MVAEEWIRKLAEEHYLEAPLVAAIVSTLSPRVSWKRQRLYQIETFLNDPEEVIDGYFINKNKALGLLTLRQYDATLLRGEKVKAFHYNLLGDRQRVTVDSWGIRAALGPDANLSIGASRYHWLAGCFKMAAAHTMDTPREFQAIVWHQVQGETHGTNKA